MTDKVPNPFFSVEEETNTAVINPGTGGVSQVTASVTISAKPLGGDAFIKLEETFTFDSPVDDLTAALRRDGMLDLLRDQALNQAQSTADAIRSHIAENAKGNVSVHPVAPAAPQGTQAGAQAPRFGAPATVAVANGADAQISGGLQWSSVQSKFGDGELRFVTTASQSTDELKGIILEQMKSSKGLNPEALVVWDNRTGPRGLEAGVPAGCVAAIKVSKEAQEFVPVEVQTIALARAKYNADGSVYVWLTKEAEAALRFGALDRIKV
jgi:hypothetical protein